MAQKWPGKGPEMARKRPRNGPEMARKWPRNGPEMAQKKATKPPLGRVNCEKERQLCHQKNVISYYPYFGLFSYVQNEIEDVFEKKRDSESMIEFLRGYREGLWKKLNLEK